MFLEYLPEPVAQRFGVAARAFDDEDFVALRAFARSGHAHLECRDQFWFFKHAPCCHRFEERILSAKAPPASEIATNCVGADVSSARRGEAPQFQGCKNVSSSTLLGG